MQTYLDPNTGEPIKDPVADAKSYLADTSYLDPNTGEPIKTNNTSTKPKSAFDKVSEIANRPLTTFASRHLPSEDLMAYGESGTDLQHKIALYGGAFRKIFGEGLDQLTSPINIALTTLAGGSGMAAKAGLANVARTLETPGRIAAGTMMYHGGSKALDSNLPVSDRIAGVAEAVLGGLGVRSNAKEGNIKSEELPTNVETSSTKTREVLQNEPAAGAKYNSSFINDKGFEEFGPKPISQFKQQKPKFRLALDNEGRTVGYEPIIENKPLVDEGGVPINDETTNSIEKISPEWIAWKNRLDKRSSLTINQHPEWGVSQSSKDAYDFAGPEPEKYITNNPLSNTEKGILNRLGYSDETINKSTPEVMRNKMRKEMEVNDEIASGRPSNPSGLTDAEIRKQMLDSMDSSTRKGFLLRESANQRAISGNLSYKEYEAAKQLKVGDTVKFGDTEGKFQSVAFGKAKVKVGDEVIIVPHEQLVRTARGPQWPEGMPLDQRVKAITKPIETANFNKLGNDPQLLSDYKSTLQEGEVPSFKGLQEYKSSRELSDKLHYLDENTGEPIATFSHTDESGTPNFQVSDTKSNVTQQYLDDNGIPIPDVPNEVPSKVPAPIKTILDTAGIDSSKMDSTTAVNEARKIQGQQSTTASPIERLKDAISKSAEARPAQEVINAGERSRRAGMMTSVETPGVAGHFERQAKLAGEYPKIPIESQLTQQDLDHLIDTVKNSELKPYEIQNAGSGIIKLTSGKQITPYESKLLGRVFGSDLEQLIHLHGGLGVVGGVKNLLAESANLGKTMKAAFDLSAPLRQGKGLITTTEFWNSFKSMVRSEEGFNTLQDGIKERPKFEFGNKAGLYLADVKEGLQNREEQFFSKQIDNVPLIGSIKKGSERAYVGFLNKLRSDLFDHMTDRMESAGIKTYNEVKVGDALEKHPTKAARDVASFINNSTGRGSLGKLEKNAAELNTLFFSPKFQTSRLTMLNPKYYKDLHPYVRLQALRSLLGIAGASIITTELLKRAGAKVSYDPTSSDFMKARIGNTRLDPNAGLQQYIVAAARLIKGETTSISGKTSKLGTGVMPSKLGLVAGIGNKYNPSLMESKFSPIAGFIDTLASGRTYSPGGLANKLYPNDLNKARLVNQISPMYIDDLIDLKKEDPDLLPGISLATLAAFGDSLQTMDEPKPKSAFRFGSMKVEKP